MFKCVEGGVVNWTVWIVNRVAMTNSRRSGRKQRCAVLKNCASIYVCLRKTIKTLKTAGLCNDSQTRNFPEY